MDINPSLALESFQLFVFSKKPITPQYLFLFLHFILIYQLVITTTKHKKTDTLSSVSVLVLNQLSGVS